MVIEGKGVIKKSTQVRKRVCMLNGLSIKMMFWKKLRKISGIFGEFFETLF